MVLVFVWFMVWRCRIFSAQLRCVTVMSSPSGSLGAGAGAGQASSPPGRLLRLCAVPGFEQHRLNDVLLLRPEPRETQATRSENAHVVFFPGDIQVSLKLSLEHRKPAIVSWLTLSLLRADQLHADQPFYIRNLMINRVLNVLYTHEPLWNALSP